MSHSEFWDVFYTNFNTYISISLFVFISSFSLFKLLRFSVFHPVVFYLFFNYQFALIAVIFLDWLGYIDKDLSFYFYSSQVSFWFGFVIIYLFNNLYTNSSRQNISVFHPSSTLSLTYRISFYFYLFFIFNLICFFWCASAS